MTDYVASDARADESNTVYQIAHFRVKSYSKLKKFFKLREKKLEKKTKAQLYENYVHNKQGVCVLVYREIQ